MNVISITLNYAGLVIGFMNLPYQVNESDSFITLEFGILDGGMITDNVSVELFFSNQSAISKFEHNVNHYPRSKTSYFIGNSDFEDHGAEIYVLSSSVTSYAVNVSIIDENENIFEFTESFQAGLRFSEAVPPLVFLSPAQADIEILDDDGEEFSKSLKMAIY